MKEKEKKAKIGRALTLYALYKEYKRSHSKYLRKKIIKLLNLDRGVQLIELQLITRIRSILEPLYEESINPDYFEAFYLAAVIYDQNTESASSINADDRSLLEKCTEKVINVNPELENKDQAIRSNHHFGIGLAHKWRYKLHLGDEDREQQRAVIHLKIASEYAKEVEWDKSIYSEWKMREIPPEEFLNECEEEIKRIRREN